MKHLIIFLSFFGFWAGKVLGQQPKIDFSQKTVEDLVAEIANHNELSIQFINLSQEEEGPEPTTQYLRYKALKGKATKTELLHLTDHLNPVVRCYAFYALVERKEEGLFSILERHLGDTAMYMHDYTCFVVSKTVVDFYTSFIKPRKRKSEIGSIIMPTSTEYERLDSLVLYLPYKTDYLSFEVLDNISPKPTYYTKIKELVQMKVYQALPALAKYQREEDIPLLLSFQNSDFEVLRDNRYARRYLFMAVKHFQHTAFIPFIKTYFQDILEEYEPFGLIFPDFYKICVQYNTKQTLEIIEEVWEQRTNIKDFESHYMTIKKVLQENPTPENRYLRDKFL